MGSPFLWATPHCRSPAQPKFSSFCYPSFFACGLAPAPGPSRPAASGAPPRSGTTCDLAAPWRLPRAGRPSSWRYARAGGHPPPCVEPSAAGRATRSPPSRPRNRAPGRTPGGCAAVPYGCSGRGGNSHAASPEPPSPHDCTGGPAARRQCRCISQRGVPLLRRSSRRRQPAVPWPMRHVQPAHGRSG